MQTRKVFCALITEDKFESAADEKCVAKKKLETSRDCIGEVTVCPGDWFTGRWSKVRKLRQHHSVSLKRYNERSLNSFLKTHTSLALR